MKVNEGASNEDSARRDAAEEFSFDELARGLADGTLSRRRALKLAGAALLAGRSPLLAGPGRGQAAA